MQANSYPNIVISNTELSTIESVSQINNDLLVENEKFYWEAKYWKVVSIILAVTVMILLTIMLLR